MADKHNALEELAERLEAIMPYVRVGCDVCVVDRHLTSKRAKDFIVTAHRIITDLAKVKNDETYTVSQMSKMTNDALAQELRDLKMSDYVEIPMADFALLEEAAIRLDKLDSYEKATKVKGTSNV